MVSPDKCLEVELGCLFLTLKSIFLKLFDELEQDWVFNFNSSAFDKESA